MDTEILLALLSSLLPEPALTQEIMLDALVQCKGNVEAAAVSLSSKKKKRGLDEWLQTPGSSSSKPPAKRVKSDSTRAPTQIKPRSRAFTEPPESTKPLPTNALARLRPPPSEPSKAPSQLPPLTLFTPTLVAGKTPCTLHPHVLPPELAHRLFEVMLNEAESWQRNRWWLFERAVESPHKSSFFVRDMTMISDSSDKSPEENNPEELREAAHFWTYTSQFETRVPSPFPDAMEEACKIIERVVSSQIGQRTQFGLEWGGSSAWIPNVAVANCYSGAKENVGFHSDALSSLGPYPTIASLSLGVSRTFRLREVVPKSESAERRPQSFNVPLAHNSLLIMHPPTQEIYKHAVIPQNTIDAFHYTSTTGEACVSNSRINVTFRFFRPDFKHSTIPKCKCDVPTILRPDMKGKRDKDGRLDRYWWSCQNGTKVKNEGKGCGMWKAMDARAEGRGPFVSDRKPQGLDEVPPESKD